MISGILPVDKPLGWTSHDVVARMRGITGQRQVGHAGTLDPLATGLLLLVLGQATKLSSNLMEVPKTYCAEVVLGATTVTDDAEAPLASREDMTGIGLPEIERVLGAFSGEIDQIPPAYAAVRQGGEKLYTLARRGAAVTARPRRVTIYRIEIEGWEPPRLRLRVSVSSGTYIRSIARDIGAALGVGGYLQALRRVSSGTIGLDDAVCLEALEGPEAVERHLLPSERAVLGWPAVVLAAEDARKIRLGQAVPAAAEIEGAVRVYDPAGTLIALANVGNKQLRPFRVFHY